MRTFLVFGVLLLSLSVALADPIRSKDGTLEAALPSGWKSAVLEGPGKIQAKSPDKNAFVTIVSESKKDFAKLNAIADYAALILKIEAGRTKLEDRTVSTPRKLKIGDHDALEIEVTGTLDSVKLIFVKTFIETAGHWNHVTAWSTPSHIDEARPDFVMIAASLHETKK